MKKRNWLVSTIVMAMFFTCAFAEETKDTKAPEPVLVDLSMPAGFETKACPAQKWKGSTAVWDGVTDKRAQEDVGSQTLNDGNLVPVRSSKPLSVVLDSALKAIFETCGVTFVPKGESHLSATINEFFAGTKKGIVTGKANAKSSISLNRQTYGGSNSVDITYELESKKLRSRKLKQLMDVLNQLLAETVMQVPAQEAVEKLVK